MKSPFTVYHDMKKVVKKGPANEVTARYARIVIDMLWMKLIAVGICLAIIVILCMCDSVRIAHLLHQLDIPVFDHFPVILFTFIIVVLIAVLWQIFRLHKTYHGAQVYKFLHRNDVIDRKVN